MTKTVVVLGGSYGGLGVSHAVVKAAIPDVKVILVTPNTHMYWNLASVRAVVPDAIPDDEIAKPLAPGFAKYSPDAFEMVIASATGVNHSAKTVSISPGRGSSTSEVISYDILVIATGARSIDTNMPWKALGTHGDTMGRLHEVRGRIRDADHIVIGGAGATGVELAAEIGYAFPKKTVTMVVRDDAVLGGGQTAGAVERGLIDFGVKFRKNAVVREARDLPKSGSAGPQSEVVLSFEDGGEETLVCDLYLPSTGLLPNTEYLDKALLNERGYLDVDEYHRVKAAEDVFGVGDVVSQPHAAYIIAEWHASQVAKNVTYVLKGQSLKSISNLPVDVFLVASGPKRGIGRIGYVPAPSFAVHFIKKYLGMEKIGGYVDGSRF